MLKYVHHVHYLVHNRDAMVEYLEKTFGMKPGRLEINPAGHGKEALYDIGETQIQITEPLDPTSPAGKHLATHGPGVYHVAWGIDNLRKAAQEFNAKGNKLSGEEGITKTSGGYLTYNIDRASSHGIWFQLAGVE